MVRAIPGLGSIAISEGCQSTLISLVSTPASACLNLPGTVAVLSTVANSSWIPPINAWLTNFCSAELCTDDQLRSTLSTAADGCSAELAYLGITKSDVVVNVIDYFEDSKAALCVIDSNNGNKFCAITTLEAIETAIGAPLTPSSAVAGFPLLVDNAYRIARRIGCTACTAAGLALVRPSIWPSAYTDVVVPWVTWHCGASFVATPTTGLSPATGTLAQVAAAATTSRSASDPLVVPEALLGIMGLLSAAFTLF
ncbi:hypothetical protein M408DRAFT_29807 [Serendipita vermifera MAFF 305830]|uniref:Uncharacterized protein n=1 Tax=Serendipita vermifera MAFF 305830 TaxID=933852 RepID=A0A0C2W3W7_SERVB|nr:hypothetical protein M408DRAFT_29807 [Serendipita vermifera MAFF 305830]